MANFNFRFRLETIEDNIKIIFFFYKKFIKVLVNYHSINRHHLYNEQNFVVKILFIIWAHFVYFHIWIDMRATFSYNYIHTHTHTRTFNRGCNSCMCAFTWRNRMIYRLTCPNELSVHFYHRFSSIAGPPPNRCYPVPQWPGSGKK